METEYFMNKKSKIRGNSSENGDWYIVESNDTVVHYKMDYKTTNIFTIILFLTPVTL